MPAIPQRATSPLSDCSIAASPSGTSRYPARLPAGEAVVDTNTSAVHARPRSCTFMCRYVSRSPRLTAVPGLTPTMHVWAGAVTRQCVGFHGRPIWNVEKSSTAAR